MRSKILKSIKWISGIAVLFGIIGYSAFAAERVFKGPAITIVSPLSGATMEDPLVLVAGSVVQAASLTLSGRLIAVDMEGRFSERLLLSYGYNMLELVATDRSGKEERKVIELFYK